MKDLLKEKNWPEHWLEKIEQCLARRKEKKIEKGQRISNMVIAIRCSC